MKLAEVIGWTVAALAIAQAVPVSAQDPEASTGKAAAIESALEWAWVEEGAWLRREPDLASATVAQIDVHTQLEVLERREGWLRLRYGALSGWISTGGEPPPDRPAGGQAIESERHLARARDVFGLRRHPERFGEFVLYTDVGDASLLELLAKISRHLRPAYEKRYGLEARPVEREAILLFEREADYRAFALESLEDGAKRITDLRGHSTPGTAALYAGDHSDEEVAAVLAHELAHMLNRRVFADPIPPWLEEGIANDLGFCRVDARGRLRLGTLGGRSVTIEQPEYDERGFLRIDRGVRLSGPMASLRTVQEQSNRTEAPLATVLTDLDWTEFTEPETRGRNYAASAFLVRYLLESSAAGSGERPGQRFRTFLRSVAAGAPAGTEELVRHLSRERVQSVDTLEAGFAAWLAAQR